MEIEDHIRDIIREKVNERVGQEMSVVKHTLRGLAIREAGVAVGNVVGAKMSDHIRYFHHVSSEEESDRRYTFAEYKKLREGDLENAGAPWSVEEDCQLGAEMTEAITEIARKHGRTENAISARLRKHSDDRREEALNRR